MILLLHFKSFTFSRLLKCWKSNSLGNYLNISKMQPISYSLIDSLIFTIEYLSLHILCSLRLSLKFSLWCFLTLWLMVDLHQNQCSTRPTAFWILYPPMTNSKQSKSFTVAEPLRRTNHTEDTPWYWWAVH